METKRKKKKKEENFDPSYVSPRAPLEPALCEAKEDDWKFSTRLLQICVTITFTEFISRKMDVSCWTTFLSGSSGDYSKTRV